jgi:hypothetical protein
MRQTINILLLMITCIILATSCRKDHWVKGEGPEVTNIRSASGFSSVSLSINAQVEIVQDSVFLIELKGQQNILNIVTTSVSGNTLDIDVKRNTVMRKHSPVTVTVHMPTLASMDISGSGDMNCSGPFSTENLNLNISGSGNISFTGVVHNSISANVSGSGGITLNGTSTCVHAKYTISGSGNINAEWMKADYVDAHISGSGDQRIYVLKQLNAHISGSGDIYYRGNPGVSADISGSGKLRQIQ